MSDIQEYLARDEGGARPGAAGGARGRSSPSLPFREKLAGTAERLSFEPSEARCHWRCSEIRNGVARADLILSPAAKARRTTPIPRAGMLRPRWDIGRPSPAGERAVSVAELWTERVRRHREPIGRRCRRSCRARKRRAELDTSRPDG